MAEKRYTVVFDAKDMASARLSEMERNARRTSRSMDELRGGTRRVGTETDRSERSYRQLNSRLSESGGRFSRLHDWLRRNNSEIDRSPGMLSRMGSGFSRMASQAGSDLSRLGGGLSSVLGILGGITTAALGAGTAIAGIAIKGTWDNIIKPAMDVESTKLQINALSGSPEKGSEIYKMSKDFGMQSVYDNEEIMNGTFSFMQNTKDTDQLREMLKIAQRLATLNKEEGFRGASFSLKEAMSGDIQSIAEVFNVSKKTLRENGFDGKADWQTNLQAVDTTLNDIGIDDKFVEEIGKSTPAQLAKMQKNVKSSFSAMGMGMLEELNPAFRKVNALFEDKKGLTKFTQAMSDKFQEALQDVFGFGDGINITWKDITEWSENTFNGVKDIITSLGDTFTSTMELFSGEDLSGPKEAFQSFGDVLSGIASTIDTINDGIKAMKKVDEASDSWFGGINDMNESLYGDSSYGLLTGWTKPFVDKFSGHALGLSYVPRDNYKANLHEGERVLTRVENREYTKMLSRPKRANDPYTTTMERPIADSAAPYFSPNEQGNYRMLLDGSHANGISYVPKNDYKANLHEGERVLTKQENRDYTKAGAVQGKGDVIITGNTFNVRNDSDIDAIGEKILMRLQATGVV